MGTCAKGLKVHFFSRMWNLLHINYKKSMYSVTLDVEKKLMCRLMIGLSVEIVCLLARCK